MRIGVIGPIWLNIPPQGYGGTEEVVYNLVNGLVDKGNDVTLFGPKTSKVKAKVFPTVDTPLRDQSVDWTNITFILNHITTAFEHASEFDILHMHLNKSQDYVALPIALYSKTPVLFTLHFKLPSPDYYHDRLAVLNKYREYPFTSISNSQREGLKLNYVATVYNSLQLENFTYRDKPEDYFVWLGKIKPVKGTKEAILAAKKANARLYILGPVDRGVAEYVEYYEKEVKPLVDGKQIIELGEVDARQRDDYLGKAKAMLNPISWDEPFGLVMAEAQATGTPVISFNKGAAPELIVDGKTGFLVNDLDEMVEKMGQIKNLDRQACRRNVEDKFTVEKMVEGYESAYNITIKNWPEYVKKQKDIL